MTPIELTVLGLAIIAALSLIYYYLFIFNKLNKAVEGHATSYPAVSVIIAARNERKNLEKFLPSILNQNYPQFEVVVVNDGSFDGTKDLVEEFQKSNPHLKLVDLNLDERYRRGKKFALTLGIKASKFDELLFTDADCRATSKNWIKSMMAAKGTKDIVLGYAPLRQRISPLGAFSYYETFHTGVQYLSYALWGKTYMGVGRNLGYSKNLFFKNKGFATHQHLLSGDDDLFIQEVANTNNVSICLQQDSFMVSDAPTKLGAYFKQKMRHISTSDLYQARYKRLLGYYSSMQLLFILSIIAMALFPKLWIAGASILALKWMIQWFVFFKPAKMLKAKLIAYFLPLFDLLYTVYIIILALFKPFYKTKEWK